jgi:coenzyme F420 hydrogenase subunit beta
LVCPRLQPRKDEDKVLGEYVESLFVKGSFLGTYSGSIVSILVAARETGLIDGVLGVTKGDNIVDPKPLYATTLREIENMAGMRHSVSSHLTGLEDVPVEDEIALVGLPCHIEAIRHLREHGLLKHQIKFLLGLACGSNYEKFKFLELLTKNDIDLNEVEDYTLRDTHLMSPYFSFRTTRGKEHRLPVSKTWRCIPRGCAYCRDYLGYGSDVSFGVLGAPKGYSIAFIRNEKGKALIDNAIKQGLIDTHAIPADNLSVRMLSHFRKLIPPRLYTPLAFKLENPISAELMALYKKYHLRKWLESKQHQNQ